MADTEYESVLCVKNEVFVYQIPARTTNRGYRAADWNLDKPDWVGRMKVISKGKNLFIRLEDKNTGELFAQCPVDSYPGIAVEQVLDSSRYFVIRIQDDNGRKAFIGIGFADRGDSFDLLVSMQDHFKWIKREETQEEEEKNSKESLDSGPKLDLGFKEGQTIRININTKKQKEHSSPGGSGKQRPRVQGGGVGILPPPPAGGARISPPPRAPAAAAVVSNPQKDALADLFQSTPTPADTSSKQKDVDLLLLNFDSSCSVSASSDSSTSTNLPPPTLQPQKAAVSADGGDPFGEFTSAASCSSTSQSNQPAGNWVSFE